jgi:hypothetical protein
MRACNGLGTLVRYKGIALHVVAIRNGWVHLSI